MIFVTKQEYHYRYDICKSCEKFKSSTKQCDVCNCFMFIKCSLNGSECPIGKWGMSISHEKEDPSI